VNRPAPCRGVLRIGLSVALAAALALPAVAAAQPPDRGKPPVPGPAPDVKLPPMAKRALSNGVPVWIVEQHEVPIVQVNVISRTGAETDPAGKFGVASLMADMLLEGAGPRDSLALADAVDFLGASLVTGAGADSAGARLNVPVARLADALPLLADVVLRPVFPAKELERLRQERLTSLLQVRDNPAALIGRAFPLVVFGRAHRYGITGVGTRAAIKSFTVEDLKTSHAVVFHPSRCALIVVGDVTADAVMPRLEAAFGSWTGRGAAAAVPAVPVAPGVARREIVLIDRPGAAQSQIRIGTVGVARSTPDYFALRVMNTMLGESFTSRLNQNLRETHGYTYGAGSRFDMLRSPGSVFAAAGVQTDKTADAVKEFFNEFAGMLKPLPEDEVARARNYVALGYPSDFETSGDLAARLGELFVYDLPAEYHSTFVGNVLKVTAASAGAVARKYVTPDRFVIVIVGDKAKIEAPLRALNLGPIRTISVDEAMGEE
jgi:predicted Zn-dependent peptidase